MAGRIFLHHAHGFALGGTITQPFAAEINSHAATSISMVGGYASAKAENYRFQDLISYRSAHTYISAIKNDDVTYSTVVDTVVEGLNILDVITADAVVGRLSAKHKDGQPSEIIPLGSGFENLRIAGQAVEVDLLNDLHSHHPSHTALLGHLQGKCKGDACAGFEPPKKVRYEWGLPAGKIPARLEKGLLIPQETGWQESRGTISCSLVKQVRLVNSNGSKKELPFGYAIRVPQVGSIYLAELFVSENTKRLNMLRVELGSPVAGSLAVSGPETNGDWYP
jgi:hypothetical protein